MRPRPFQPGPHVPVDLDGHEAAHPSTDARQLPARPVLGPDDRMPWHAYSVVDLNSPHAGLVPMRPDYGVVRHSEYSPQENDLHGLPIRHVYAAPQSTLAVGPPPSARVSGAFAPQTDDVLFGLWAANHWRAQQLPRRGQADLPQPAVRSSSLFNGEDGPPGYQGRPPALPPEHEGVARTCGALWPRPPAPPPLHVVAKREPRFYREGARAALPHPRTPPVYLLCAPQETLPVVGDAPPAALRHSLHIAEFAGTALPMPVLQRDYAAARTLTLEHCQNLENLVGLLAALPHLRRLNLLFCPALALLDEPLQALADRGIACVATDCPALVDELDALDALRSIGRARG